MIIKNAIVLLGDFNFKQKDIFINNGKIAEIGDNFKHDTEIINAEGQYLLPGLIDTHTHGCVGFDTCDQNIDGYKKMSEFYAKNGVTSFLFTTMTFPEDKLTGVLKDVSEYMNYENDIKNDVAYSHGIYLEGPFISKKKNGAQCIDYISMPDFDMFERLRCASHDNIRIISIAPEVDGCMNFIKKIKNTVSVTIGHTDANYEEAMESIKNGVSGVTHLFNAMPKFLHREPGVVGAALDSDIFIEIICDGVHIHPSIIRTVFKAAGNERVVLISDSISAAGMEDGVYYLGGQEVILNNNKALLKDGTIAGSTTTLFECVKNCIKFGIPIQDAVRAATINPAKRIKKDHITGSIEIGKNADLLLVDKNFNLKNVFIKGKKINLFKS